MRTLAFTGVLAAWLGATATAGPRHLPSPDWRDQIVYFVLIDRFDDGDPSNNDQGAGEYDPSSRAHYSGGDLAGITRRLDYVQGLGATALWITPPVRHQWWDGSVGYGGYHGYWGEHFAQVDPHFGTLDDYRALAQALHARDMRLIQDVVVNHTGNYFNYASADAARDVVGGHQRNPDPRPNPAPTQWPFSLNDARDPVQRAADIYHWTPTIADFSDPVQERTWQLASLDDLNTGNPVVRRALRASYGHWIREVGVDAFRIDTAFYVPPDYFRDFLQAEDPAAPGVLRVAAATGRADFHVFGEGFGVDRPFEDVQARKIEAWTRDAEGPLLPAMINFPLYGSLLDVFARGRPSAVLAHRIESMMQVHADPHRMPSFVDNHDVDRFLAGGDEAGLRLALFAIHALPGIPVIYYGTEQGFTEPRAAMFAAGYGSGGRDHFDPQAPLYRELKRLAELRRTHPTLSRGTPRVIASQAAAPGAVVYTMRHADDTLLIALNAATHPVLVANADTGLAAGAGLQPRFALDGEAAALVLDAAARFTAVLPARSAQVWRVGAARTLEARPALLQIDALPAKPAQGSLALHGQARGVDAFELVVDGDLSNAHRVQPGPEGRWQARVPVEDFVDADAIHEVVAWSKEHGVASAPRAFRAAPAWKKRLAYSDPARDDHGPDGRYVYPRGSLWQHHRTADLREVLVHRAGASLRIDVRLAELVAGWNPPNGFDHVALTLFLELPGRDDGARVMPGQHAELPDGMRWHYRLRVGGWSNALFCHPSADARNEGRPAPAAAGLDVDRAEGLLRLTLPAAALAHPESLDGARLYLTTWDYDGGYRGLAAQPAAFRFGGGKEDGPRIMDDTPVLRLGRE
jgi:glycosidase